jgi:hypothetical protein
VTHSQQVTRALVDSMTAGSSSADTNYMACVALASDSPDILQLFQSEFGDRLIHVDGPVVHIDRRCARVTHCFRRAFAACCSSYLTRFSPSETITAAAIDKLFADYILLGLTDITVCGGGSFCTLAALHTDRPLLSYPSRPPTNTPLCLQNARIIGPARHVNGDGSRCTLNVEILCAHDVSCDAVCRLARATSSLLLENAAFAVLGE